MPPDARSDFCYFVVLVVSRLPDCCAQGAYFVMIEFCLCIFTSLMPLYYVSMRVRILFRALCLCRLAEGSRIPQKLFALKIRVS